jgi:hypothetical protein
VSQINTVPWNMQLVAMASSKTEAHPRCIILHMALAAAGLKTALPDSFLFINTLSNPI